MKNFKVLFTSHDNQGFLFQTQAVSEQEAIDKGFDRIKENGWDVYGYILTNISEEK